MSLSTKVARAGSLFAVLMIGVFAFACSGGSAPGTSGGTIALQGAGATFPNPLYQKWLSEYGKLHANVRIDYQSIGSGGGIKQIQAQTVDFGASDAPMSDADLKSAPGELLHIPTVLGAVVVTGVTANAGAVERDQGGVDGVRPAGRVTRAGGGIGVGASQAAHAVAAHILDGGGDTCVAGAE